MSKFIEDFKARRALVPKWITAIVLLFVFIYPIYLVVGKDNMFDYILESLQNIAGPDESFIYLLSYLICVIILLLPSGFLLQLIGYFYHNKSEK